MLVAALSVLAVLAGTMTYTGFLVIGVLADHLDTSRFMAGLLLGVLFARFPWMSKGRPRIVGLLPKPLRRPVVVSLLALCSLDFVSRGEYVSLFFTGFAAAFVLALPWARRAVFGRLVSSIFPFAGRESRQSADDRVIDGEFREKRD